MSEKRKYRVTKHEVHDSGDGDVRRYEKAIGETWAVSPRKAINNVCFRAKMTAHGYIPLSGDGVRRWYCTAEEIGA